jgi:CBS-domain-containing membrane protein
MSNPRVGKVGLAPVERRETLSDVDSRPAAEFVLCKNRRATVDVDECKECPRCVGVSKTDGVACWIETLELDRTPAPHALGRIDLREAATVASAAEVMHRGQVTVTAEASIDGLQALFARQAAHAAPVVDAEGKLIGIVSEADLARWHASRAGTAAEFQATAGDIMSRVVHALPEGAPLAYAFGLLAACGLREAPIVKDDGRVVGMITSTDLLRWVARDLGYVLPD